MSGAGARRFGILAGGGRLPKQIADSLKTRGEFVHIVAFEGEADADFSPHPVTWVRWGQVGALLRAFKNANCSHLVIIGQVKRPDLARLQPDWGLVAALPTALRILLSGGDDSLLRHVATFFERHGLQVVGPGEVAPELLITTGPLSAGEPEAEDHNLFIHGFRVLDALSPYDVGQAVVVSADMQLEAIEGIEGTDAMLSRIAAQRRITRTNTSNGEGYFIKAPKLSQDLRVDLPAVGPRTVRLAADAFLKGLVLQADRVLAVDKEQIVQVADANDLVVFGADRRARDNFKDIATNEKKVHSLAPYRNRGRVAASKQFTKDAELGAAVLHALAPFMTTMGSAVVVGGHVLAVATVEDIAELCHRVSRNKQWGSIRWMRRRGVLVVRRMSDVNRQSLDSLLSAGLAGLAVVGVEPEEMIPPDIQAEFDEASLVIGSIVWHNQDQSNGQP